MIKSILYPLIFLGLGFLFSKIFGINPLEHTDVLLVIGGLFLAVALFGNVQGIDREFLEENKLNSIISVSLVLLFKAGFLGVLSFLIFHDKNLLLVAALMSQIDPSFTNWAQRMLGIKGRVAKLSLVESTFDDPVSTLITIYLALPFIASEGLRVDQYMIFLFFNFIFVVVFIFERRRGKIQNEFLSTTSIVIGGLTNLFLGVALSGLIFKVKKEIFDEPINIITYISYFIIGLFLNYSHLNILVGVVLGLVLVFVVRPLEVLIFFHGFNLREKFILASAEQKGITTILLLLIVQPKVDLVGIVIPALVVINILFFINNYSIKFIFRNSK